MESSAELTDQALLRAYIDSDDSESLGAFFIRYQHSLVRFMGSFLRDPHTAQDVVQETFIQVARHPKRLLKVKNYHNWLLRVARNIGIDHIRREARSRKHSEALKNQLVSQSPSKTGTAEKVLETEELRDKVLFEIDRLKPRSREVILLKIQEEKSYREIAEITDLTITNVGFILHQAMKTLSAKFNYLEGGNQ